MSYNGLYVFGVLTTEVRRTPTNVDAVLGAGVCIGSHRCAQTLAIAALIAGARIENATFQVLLNRHFSVAILRKIGEREIESEGDRGRWEVK